MSSRLVLLAALATALAAQAQPAEWNFDEVSSEAGLVFLHAHAGDDLTEPMVIGGGIAAGDYDRDGLVDLYAVSGSAGTNALWHNKGDGTFEEVASAAGVAIEGESGSGPLFFDFDGDGHLDLLVGNTSRATPHLFRNRGDGTFEDRTASAGLPSSQAAFGAAASDIDRDGDLDLFLAPWALGTRLLWLNDGSGSFSDATSALDPSRRYPYAFTPNFSDVDGDGWPDLALTSDFGASALLLNKGDGSFGLSPGADPSDENGMGAAIGDYDNDGDLDWFVSSIWDEDGVSEGNWGVTGNRLYRNEGEGVFSDVTELAGVREGYWGWGSCFADLDNDGDLDLFQANGFPLQELVSDLAPEAEEKTFDEDPSRLWVNQGDGTFVESSAVLGIDDRGQGRGVVCFDYDRDGDIDLLVANNRGPLRLYRNNLHDRIATHAAGHSHFLTVRLFGTGHGQPVGARIEVHAGGQTQLREIRAGSNFASQNPLEAHFGLGAHLSVERLRVLWPDGKTSSLRDLEVDFTLTIERLLIDDFESGDLGSWSSVINPNQLQRQ